MYFKIFKPISWGKRPAERRSRFIQRFLNDAICHPEQNSLLGATSLGLHSRSKCLRCGFSCIFFEVSDSLRGEASSSAETTAA